MILNLFTIVGCKDILDVRQLFDGENAISSPRKGKSINLLKEAINVVEESTLDPVYDVRFFLKNVEANEEKTAVPNITDNEVNKTEEVTQSPVVSRDEGSVKATLIRDGKALSVQGGLDFKDAVFDPELGKRCIIKEEKLETIERNPILECQHR